LQNTVLNSFHQIVWTPSKAEGYNGLVGEGRHTLKSGQSIREHKKERSFDALADAALIGVVGVAAREDRILGRGVREESRR
jgi:hypothetical protein